MSYYNVEKPQSLASDFCALAETSKDSIVRYDRNCRRLYANPTFANLTGVHVKDLLGKRPSDFSPLQDVEDYEKAISAVFLSGKERVFELSRPKHNGLLFAFQIQITPELGPNGDVVSVLAVGRDFSELKNSERQLQRVERMAQIGHWQWNFIRQEAELSDEACRIFGYLPNWNPSLVEILNLVVDKDRGRIRKIYRVAFDGRETEISYPHQIERDEGIYHLFTHARIEYGADGVPSRVAGITQDISELKHYESRLYEMAFHDALTGLPNRDLLTKRLERCLAEAIPRNQVVALLVLDLDHFKRINDIHGHSTGDSLLFETAERLRKLIQNYDTVTRLGGDEFAIVLPKIRDASVLGKIARKVLDALACPFRISNHEFFISASIGIAVAPADGITPAKLLQHADAALFDAKDHGRAGYRFYSAELTARSIERSQLENALRRAEPDGELELFYQPKIDLKGGHLIGAEALLRWHHPDMGLVTPDKFIKIAEDNGLIVNIGTWVLTKACLAARRWNENGNRKLKIAVNLSSRQFYDDDLVATVCSVLTLTDCDPRWIELEITESILLNDNENVRTTLQSFRNLGISIAIDDFGTGYSSLSYLKRFPIDVLKIDRSFTCDVTLDRDSTEVVKAIISMAHSLRLNDRDSTEVVKAIISMAHSLRLKLVAEGIETEVQEHFLHKHGCNIGQGYRYGRPMSSVDFEAHPLMAQRLLHSKQKNTEDDQKESRLTGLK